MSNKKKEPKVYEYLVLPYGSTLYFTTSGEAYADFCKNNNLEVPPETFNGPGNFTTFHDLRLGIIYVTSKTDRKMLVHEVTHAALWVFYDIGQEVSHEVSAEPFCYTLDNIYEWCINCLNGKVE